MAICITSNINVTHLSICTLYMQLSLLFLCMLKGIFTVRDLSVLQEPQPGLYHKLAVSKMYMSFLKVLV